MYVVIWQGRGLLAFVVPFLLVLILQVLIVGIGSRELWAANNNLFIGHAGLASAGVIYLLARRWKDPGRVLIDKTTGREFVLRRQDTFFFVPLRMWPLIWAACGVLMLVRGLLV